MWYSISFWAGLLFLGIGIFLLNERIAFIKQGNVAVATVIELKEDRDSDDGKTYTPVFRFITNNKEEIIHVHNVSTNPPSWSIGDEAKVVYHKNLPHKAVVLTYMGSFAVAVIWLSVALVCLSIPIGYYWSRKFFNSLS